MSDRAESVAFDPTSPLDERVDALSAVQSVHMPGMSDLLPAADIQAVIDDINFGYEEAAIRKAINANIVPFPSKASKEKKSGMQSLRIDDWAISIQGDYWDRPSALGFDSMRAMVEQTPVLNAVIMTRVRQVQRFCRVAETQTPRSLPSTIFF